VKIALVCDWYAPRLGGIEVQLEALARRLTRAGHQIQIITTTPGPSAPGVVRLSVPLLAGVGVMYTGRGFAALDEALAGGGFDVVHSHISIVSPAAIGAGFLANRLGIPLVVTFHSWIPGMRALTRTIGGALGSRHWIALFTAVSARVAREVAPCAPGEHIELLPNGVDSTKWGQSPLISAAKTTGEFQEGQSRLIASKPFEIVSVMRLNAKKRPGALLSVMAELKRTLPARMNVRLRVAGDGPERARLERAIAKRGLDDCVELLGRRSHDEIRALYGECDAFVLPTVRESFGIAAAEARCAGLPIVARGGSGVDDWIEHERDGLLASTDAGLADALVRLLTDDALRTRIARHNRATTPSVDWAPVLERHLELYARAIALRRSVSA